MLLDITLWKDNEIVFEKKDVDAINEEMIITFNIDNMYHEIDLKTKKFKRENDEFTFLLDFENKLCTYELKDPHAMFDIIVDDSTFEIGKHQITMEYAIETDDQKNKINIAW